MQVKIFFMSPFMNHESFQLGVLSLRMQFHYLRMQYLRNSVYKTGSKSNRQMDFFRNLLLGARKTVFLLVGLPFICQGNPQFWGSIPHHGASLPLGELLPNWGVAYNALAIAGKLYGKKTIKFAPMARVSLATSA